MDTDKYFVIASDSIGTGKSSKPSDGLGMRFPKYRLDDVVHAQKRLLAEALDVQLVAVIGISYGGRQTWQWGVQYPEARGLVPLISSPFPNAGRRGMQDFLPAEAITSDPTWNNGAYKEQPSNFPLAVMMFRLSRCAGHLWKSLRRANKPLRTCLKRRNSKCVPGMPMTSYIRCASTTVLMPTAISIV